MTNLEKIQSMSKEEIIEFWAMKVNCEHCHIRKKCTLECREEVKIFLDSEYKEEEKDENNK